MRFDLCFPLIDIAENPNREWYRAAAKLMIASARKAFSKHDIRLVQLTDEASEVAEDIDIRFTPASKVEFDEMAQYRGHCTAEWALQADRPAILCDVDLLWNNDTLIPALDKSTPHGAPDIVLCKRDHMEVQPFNGGMILTQPGQTLFWTQYKAMMKHLPKNICGWWGDQIGLAVMMGLPEKGQGKQVKFGSTVVYLPMDVVVPSPKSQPTELLDNPAVHLKGAKRKPWMVDYFKMLEEKWRTEDADAVVVA